MAQHVLMEYESLLVGVGGWVGGRVGGFVVG